MPWFAKKVGRYEHTSTEAYENCKSIYSELYDFGWTLNAVAGLLGNIAAESGYNPWTWQGDWYLGEAAILSTNDTYLISHQTGHAYGLVQFDEAGKYIYNQDAQSFPGYGPNFSNRPGRPEDGYAQIQFINEFQGQYYPTSAYPLSYSDYKQSSQTPEYLAAAFLYNYERPLDPQATLSFRQNIARYWFDLFGGYTPDPPEPPGPPDPPPPGPTPYDFEPMNWIYYLRQKRWY